MLQKVENLLKKFWKGIVLGLLLTIITILVIINLNSQNEFMSFKNSETQNYFWYGNTYKNSNEYNELFIIKNTDLINNSLSLNFNNDIEMVEILSLNGEKLDKVFNYEILSNQKNSIKEFHIKNNTIVLKLVPHKGIAKVKIGFKNSVNKNRLKIEDQLLVKIFHYHTAD